VYAGEVVTSEPFTRQGGIPGLGYAKALSDAVFASPPDAWLKEPFATPKGAVIAMPAEIIPLKDDEWEKIKPRAMAVVLESKTARVMNAFIGDLHRKAEIVVSNPEIFGQ
jgi:peptidyl-prolyl cis-trans isomerase D